MADGTFEVRDSYKSIYSIHIPVGELRDRGCVIGEPITFLVAGVPDFSHLGGKPSKCGLVSGMAWLYKAFGLEVGDRIDYEFNQDGSVTLALPTERLPEQATTAHEAPVGEVSVFDRQALTHVHIEPFRPESLESWEPENETDVFMVFGYLQEYTQYRYCCGLSQSLIRRLGYRFEGASKPDAVVLEEGTGRYLVAEWKKDSSSFKLNHEKDDVDVLIVWNDDEANRDGLPKVLTLREVARAVAAEALTDEA